MDLLNSIVSKLMQKRMHQINLFQRHPVEIQHRLLDNLIYKAKGTEYGKKYEFASISNYENFKNKLPIISYEDIVPYIQRLMKGEQNLLWFSDIKWFAKSSGTTNTKSKFIPVSQEALEDCHFKGGKDLLSIYYTNYPESKLFTGKGLVIGGSLQPNLLNHKSKSFYGDVSAVLMQNLPWWSHLVRTPKLVVALMDEWENKIDKMVKITSSENVTNLAGAPTWINILLEKVLAYKKAKHILEVWPNLEVFFHGAVAFTPYEDLFETLIPSSNMKYIETYNATEGFFGIQDQKKSKDMLLMLDYGIFYEFILYEQGSYQSEILSLDQVEIGKNYAIVISTNSGLWRYKIGDTVTFTSKYPYRIKITGRTKHFINTFGEELIIENAEKAIAYSCKKTNASIDNFTAGPRYMGNNKRGSHEWIIEFMKEPDSMSRFSQILDEKLREINSDYDAKRYKNIILDTPVIRKAAPKTFYNWMKAKGKLGSQNKVPRLSNSREFLDELIKFCKN